MKTPSDQPENLVNECAGQGQPMRMLSKDEQAAKEKAEFEALPIEERINSLRDQIAKLGVQFSEVIGGLHQRITRNAQEFSQHDHDEHGHVFVKQPPSGY